MKDTSKEQYLVEKLAGRLKVYKPFKQRLMSGETILHPAEEETYKEWVQRKQRTGMSEGDKYLMNLYDEMTERFLKIQERLTEYVKFRKERSRNDRRPR